CKPEQLADYPEGNYSGYEHEFCVTKSAVWNASKNSTQHLVFIAAKKPRKRGLLDDDHDQITWTVHPFDARELNIGGRRRTRDQRGGTLRVNPRNHLGHAVNNLRAAHDANVTIWNQGQGTTAIGFT